MNIKDKIKRLEQLKRIEFPSDQELEEIEYIEEQLRMIDEDIPIKQPDKIKKQKKTVFEWIYDKVKEKPATREEIEQLRLNAERARIKADIAKNKSKAKEYKSKGRSGLQELFGPMDSGKQSEQKFTEDNKAKSETLGYK